MKIRLEEKKDYRTVEELTREAFWNLHVPGCDEHFLAHFLRTSPDFIPTLDFVAEKGGRIVGNIMYTRSKIVDEAGREHPVVTFGPLSVHPDFQKKGIGKALVEHSKKEAASMGFKAIVIFGHPSYYPKLGFKAGKDFGIRRSDGKFAPALMVLELVPGALSDVQGRFSYSKAFEDYAKGDFESFDSTFPAKEKRVTPSQKEFEIVSGMAED